MASTTKAQLIDVRTNAEFQSGHLANAQNIDISSEDFEKKISTFDKTTPVFVYCLSGGRSQKATEVLLKNGFTTVYDLKGGMMKWRSAGLPEVKATTTQHDELTMDAFMAKVAHGTILVDFHASWCGPCRTLSPIVEKVVEENKDKIQLLRIDVNEHPELAKQLQVTEIPLLLWYKEGKLSWQHVGVVDASTIQNQL